MKTFEISFSRVCLYIFQISLKTVVTTSSWLISIGNSLGNLFILYNDFNVFFVGY